MKSACQKLRQTESTGMKYCLKCCKVWERKTAKSNKIYHYTEITSYKKPRETCPDCLGVKKQVA
jgi:hypothetical protein